MTRFDMKVVIFVNKIAKCRKSATVRPSTCRVGKPDLWKILSGRVLLWSHLRPRRYNVDPNLLGRLLMELREGGGLVYSIPGGMLVL